MTSNDRPRPRDPRSTALPDGVIAMLVKRLDEFGERLDDLAERLGSIERDAAARTAARRSGPRPLDDVSVATLAFLREHASLKFTALSISENLDDEAITNEQVGSRLSTLATRGLVVRHERAGRQAMWQVREHADEVTS